MIKNSLYIILGFFLLILTATAQEEFEIKLDESKDGRTVVEFLSPKKICVDYKGNVYMMDKYGKYLKSISPEGFVRTISITESVNFEKEIGELGQFIKIPKGIATDLSGNLFVIGYSKDYIIKIDPMGLSTKLDIDYPKINKKIEFLSGNYMIDHFKIPRSITFDTSGNIYIANKSEHIIQKIDIHGTIFTIAGTGSAGYLDSTGLNSLFAYPTGISADQKGNLFIADTWNHRIRKIDNKGWVTTFSGSGVQGLSDGLSEFAKFSLPVGVAVDGYGYVFVADYGNKLIRRINPFGTVTTFPGVKTQVYTTEIVAEDTSMIKQFKPKYIKLNELISQLGKSREEQLYYIEQTQNTNYQSEVIASNASLGSKDVVEPQQKEIPIVSKKATAKSARIETENLQKEEKKRKKKAEEDSLHILSVREKAEKARAEMERIKKTEEEQFKKDAEEKAKAEEERLQKEEAEKARLEAERLKKQEDMRKKNEEDEKLKRETEQSKKEEAENTRLEAEHLKKQEDVRKKNEEDEKLKRETEQLKIEEAEKARLEAEHLKKQEEVRKKNEDDEKLKRETEQLKIEEAEKTRLKAELIEKGKDKPVVSEDTISISKQKTLPPPINVEPVVLKDRSPEPENNSETDYFSLTGNRLFNENDQSEDDVDFTSQLLMDFDSLMSSFKDNSNLELKISNVYGVTIVHQTLISGEFKGFLKLMLKGLGFVNGWYLFEITTIKEGQKYRKKIFIK